MQLITVSLLRSFYTDYVLHTHQRTEEWRKWGTLTNKQNGWGIKRDVLELAEWSKIVLTIFACGTDPATWSWDNEGFKGIVGKTALLAEKGLVEYIFAGHG